MAETAVAPRLVKHIEFTCGTDSFSKHINSAIWNPSSSTVTWQGGTPDAVFTDQTSPTYVLDLIGIQDWETETSLCNWLHEHIGETAIVRYKPHFDGAVVFTANIVVGAPPIGGKVGTYNEFTVKMGSDKPVRSRETPPEALMVTDPETETYSTTDPEVVEA